MSCQIFTLFIINIFFLIFLPSCKSFKIPSQIPANNLPSSTNLQLTSVNSPDSDLFFQDNSPASSGSHRTKRGTSHLSSPTGNYYGGSSYSSTYANPSLNGGSNSMYSGQGSKSSTYNQNGSGSTGYKHQSHSSSQKQRSRDSYKSSEEYSSGSNTGRPGQAGYTMTSSSSPGKSKSDNSSPEFGKKKSAHIQPNLPNPLLWFEDQTDPNSKGKNNPGWTKLNEYPSWAFLNQMMSKTKAASQMGSRDSQQGAQDDVRSGNGASSTDQLVTLFRGVGFAELDADDVPETEDFESLIDPAQLRPVGWIVMEPVQQ